MKGSIFIKLGIFFIASSFVVVGAKTTDSAFKEFNNDYLLSRIIVTKTKESYDTFNEKVSKYKEDISNFYDSLDFYYDQFIEVNKTISSKAKNIEEDLKEMEEVSLDLFNNCKYDIDDEEMNNICKSYKQNLSNTVDSYEKLVTDYNDLISMYNDYASLKNKTIVKEYESKISDKLTVINDKVNN